MIAARAVLGLALWAIATAAAPAPRASQQAVEEALTCQCGCGLTVHSCNHLQCPSGEPMKKEIAERLARGESKDTILEAFRTKYGEKVLSSPTFRGFNWFAWLTPFGAVLLGGLAVSMVIRRWVRTVPPTTVPPPPAAAGDAARRRRLARELEELDRS